MVLSLFSISALMTVSLSTLLKVSSYVEYFTKNKNKLLNVLSLNNGQQVNKNGPG